MYLFQNGNQWKTFGFGNVEASKICRVLFLVYNLYSMFNEHSIKLFASETNIFTYLEKNSPAFQNR